ncbi:MAG: ABC transporter permease subunit, partial [Myxococcota bacterium]
MRLPALVRWGIVAATLPFAVTAAITLALWALPGDPADILCPPEICEGTALLARAWNLDRGPTQFFVDWTRAAFVGDLGRSWRVMPGVPIAQLVGDALPNTLTLVGLATLGLAGGSLLGLVRGGLARLDALWQLVGLVPAVIVALAAAAWVELTFGLLSYDGTAGRWRLALGVLTLVVADRALGEAVSGTRQVFTTEFRRRYIDIARLRGESIWANALPNVLPTLARQWRARVLAVLSGTVVVEVVLRIEGLGQLLFQGTLRQDFGLVLAATWLFAL